MSSPYTNGAAYDFTPTYKYTTSTSTSTSSTTPSTPSFTRMTYAKDGRGHTFTTSYPYTSSTNADSESQSLTSSGSNTSDAKIEYGVDGLARGPYDLGQRVRPVSFFSRHSHTGSARSSRASSRSSFFSSRRDGSTSSKRS